MKTVKQLLEHYSVFNDKEYGEKLKAIVDAGLLDESKLPILKRALQKESKDFTNAEKKVYDEVFHSLTEANYLSKFDDRRPMGFKGEKDAPSVLILKRKAIRVYPDNQKIALYYSDMIDKYFSIPFGPNTQAAGIHISESKKSKDKDLPAHIKAELQKIRQKDSEEAAKERILTSRYGKDNRSYRSDWAATKSPEGYSYKKAETRELPAGSAEEMAFRAGRATRLAAMRGIHKLRGKSKSEFEAPSDSEPKTETPKTPSQSAPKRLEKKSPAAPEMRRLKPEEMPSQMKKRELERAIAAGEKSFPKPKPTTQRPPVAAGPLRTRSPEETEKRAKEILRKNEKQKFSKGAEEKLRQAKASTEPAPTVKKKAVRKKRIAPPPARAGLSPKKP